MSDALHQPPTEHDAKEAFRAHLADKALKARLKYGLYIDTEVMLKLLDDREVVRYPTSICFDAGPLQGEEFAFVQPLGFHSSDGLCLFIHPWFECQPEILPMLIAYHIPVINYGDIADSDDAELYGATLLGLEVEAYYQALCELADSIPRHGH